MKFGLGRCRLCHFALHLRVVLDAAVNRGARAFIFGLCRPVDFVEKYRDDARRLLGSGVVWSLRADGKDGKGGTMRRSAGGTEVFTRH
jgi:hypothetical protein